MTTKLNRNILQTKYKKEEECSICLLSMFNKQVLTIPCGHVFHKNCITMSFHADHPAKYKCPLCRFNNYPALKLLGYPEQEEEEQEEEAEDDELETTSDVIIAVFDLIGQSFSPICFRKLINEAEAVLCPICNDTFTYLLESSVEMDEYIKIIIQDYHSTYNSFIDLFQDIIKLANFDDADEYIRYIYPHYVDPENNELPHL